MDKILIAVPCMDQVPSQFAQSLASLTKVGACVIAFQMGSLVYTSRNNLAVEAVKRGADYIMWFDSDMMFPANTLEVLMDDIKKAGDNTIMTGVYCRRVPPFSPTIFSSLDIEGEHSTWTDYTDLPDGLFEVAGCGFGCVLAPTQVFIDVQAKFEHMFSPIGDVGEDLSFCWRARQCGWKIVCDPRIELGHVGHHIITRDFWEEYRAYAQEQKNGNSGES